MLNNKRHSTNGSSCSTSNLTRQTSKESSMKENGKFFSFTTLPSASRSFPIRIGKDLTTKFFKKLSKLGDHSSKSKSQEFSHFHLNGGSGVPIDNESGCVNQDRRNSTTAAFLSRKKKPFTLLPIGRSRTDPPMDIKSHSMSMDTDDSSAIERFRSFSLTPEFNGHQSVVDPDEIYNQGSYLKKKGSIRRGFGGNYNRLSYQLSPHPEDSLSYGYSEDQDESFEGLEDFCTTNCSESLSILNGCNDTIYEDIHKNNQVLEQQTFDETGSYVDRRVQALRRRFREEIEKKVFFGSEEVFEKHLSEEEETKEQTVEKADSDMKKIKVRKEPEDDSRNGSPRRTVLQPSICLKDDPRKTIFDPDKNKRHSACQGTTNTIRTSEKCGPEEVSFFSAHNSRDDVSNKEKEVVTSFRSSMPAVTSHTVKNFGSQDFSKTLKELKDKSRVAFFNHSAQEDVDGRSKNKNNSLNKFESICHNTKLSSTCTQSSINLNAEGRNNFLRVDANNYVQIRNTRDARRKFFESDRSPENLTCSVPLLEDNSVLQTKTKSRHQQFLSQLSYEPKLLREDEFQKRTSCPPEKFDKRFSTSSASNFLGSSTALSIYRDPGIHRNDDHNLNKHFEQKHRRISSAIPVHRKRESLDSGFDMRMEESLCYPASEDSTTSISSPESTFRQSVFSPTTKTYGPPVLWQTHSSKFPYNTKDCRNGKTFTSHSVTTPSFSSFPVKRAFSTMPRMNVIRTISIFQLNQDKHPKSSSLLKSLEQLADQLQSIEIELVGYSAAIMKSHKMEKTSLKNCDESSAVVSKYIPNFLSCCSLCSSFHIKEFLPKFFLDKFPWRPLDSYSFDATGFNGEDDDDDSCNELDYPEIRNKLEGLTRKQQECLRSITDFIGEHLAEAKDARSQVLIKVQSKLSEKEMERCQTFATESDKIVKLLVLISQRISRHLKETMTESKENSKNSCRGKLICHCESDANQLTIRDNKLAELEAKLGDAKLLKESIERKGMVIHEILSLKSIEKVDLDDLIRTSGEVFILPLLLLWTMERSKLASEFMKRLETLAENELVLGKHKERKEKQNYGV